MEIVAQVEIVARPTGVVEKMEAKLRWSSQLHSEVSISDICVRFINVLPCLTELKACARQE